MANFVCLIQNVPSCSSCSRALRKESGIGASQCNQSREKSKNSRESHLGKVHTEGIHIQAVQEACEVLTEPSQTLMHQLKMHKISLQVRH